MNIGETERVVEVVPEDEPIILPETEPVKEDEEVVTPQR